MICKIPAPIVGEKILKVNGLLLACVKAEDQTEALCLTAVKQNHLTLRYVARQNENIVNEAIKNSADALMFVDYNFQKF
jgi:hypothetical protein